MRNATLTMNWQTAIFPKYHLHNENFFFIFLIWCSSVDSGGGGGGRCDLHSGGSAAARPPQQSHRKFPLTFKSFVAWWALQLPACLPLSRQSSVTRSQCVKAGTEEKLVLHLLHSFSMGDSSFVTIFLSTYRSFTSTKRVLDILTDRWEGIKYTYILSLWKHNFSSSEK